MMAGCDFGAYEVAAVGYDCARFDLQAANVAAESIRVALRPSAVLAINCRNSEGRPIAGQRVYVVGDDVILTEPWSARSHALISAYRGSSPVGLERNGLSVISSSDQDGKVVFWGLRPGVPLRVGFKARGSIVAERSGIVLGVGERLSMDLQSSEELYDLRVSVVDESGSAISGAEVRGSRSVEGAYMEEVTDVAGEATFSEVPFQELRLLVTKPGYTVFRGSRVCGSDDESWTVTLHPAPPIDLIIVSSSGEPIDPMTVVLRNDCVANCEGGVEKIEPGKFRVIAPVDETLLLDVSYGLYTHHVRVDPERGPVQKVTLPEHAEFEVHWTSRGLPEEAARLSVAVSDREICKLEFPPDGRVRSSLPLGEYRCWVEYSGRGTSMTRTEPQILGLNRPGFPGDRIA